MALVRDLSSVQLVFKVGDGPEDQFSVVRYRGTEGLSQLYRFEIELVTDDEVAFDDVVGKPGVLSINSDTGSKVFHGIVSRFEFTGEVGGRIKFRAELVPAVWLLTHRYNSRIFQKKTIKEIITAVLDQGGIPSDRIKLDGITGAETAREYCVQYRETDYNFICRLMEEEGIWWYFEQTEEGHIFTAADNKSEYADIEGESAELPFRPPSGMLVEEEHVFSFRKTQSVRMGKVVLNDFNFKNPKLNLESLGDAGRDLGLEFFDYPGEYDAQAVGTNLAKMRVEEFEASRIRGVGRSNSVRLGPGKKFELTEHSSEPMNQSYLITRVTHQGRQSITDTTTGAANGQAKMFSSTSYQNLVAATRTSDRTVAGIATATLDLAARLSPNDRSARRAMTEWLYHAGQICRDVSATAGALGGNPIEALSIPNLIEDVSRSESLDLDMPVYSCDFECIPADVEYRPPRVTPWPVMRGCQTARVVGSSGDEIHCDKYGRVKVQFNWDREGKFDDKSSCFIRVNQGFAGGQYGMMFLPRVGQEVIVDFLEGDPDQPIITGRVYNADQMPPYELPKEKTKSCIKTHSSKGGGGTNEIRFEDLKGKEQILIYAQSALHVRANSNRVENIGADRHLTVAKNKFELVKEKKHTEVKSDLNEKVGGDKSLSVDHDVNESFGGDKSLFVQNDHIEMIGGDQELALANNLREEVGGDKMLIVRGDVVEQVVGDLQHDVVNTYQISGMDITLKAASSISLVCGGSSMVLTPSAFYVKAGDIHLNSEPPPAPVETDVATEIIMTPNDPKPPEPPTNADSAKPGKDETYKGGEELPPQELEPDIPVETSWIDLKLVDSDGNPVPFERFRITTSDGRVIDGALDENGYAHVADVKEGECKIEFEHLDGESWKRG